MLFSGTEEQKQEYLPRFCDADRPIMTAALVEPRIAFDPGGPRRPPPGDGTFTLNGEKAYVPLAADAEAILVYARNTETGSVDSYIVPATPTA